MYVCVHVFMLERALYTRGHCTHVGIVHTWALYTRGHCTHVGIVHTKRERERERKTDTLLLHIHTYIIKSIVHTWRVSTGNSIYIYGINTLRVVYVFIHVCMYVCMLESSTP